MAKKDKKKKGTTISLDFSDTESRAGVPDGQYRLKVAGVEEKEGNEFPYLNWKLEVISKKNRGSTVWHSTSTSPQSLWALRAWLEALGVEIPNEVTEIDLTELEGLELDVTVEKDEEKRSKIVDYSSTEDGEEEESAEVEDEDDKKSKKKSKKDSEDEDEEEADEEDEEEEKSSKKKKKSKDEDEEEEADEEEDEDDKKSKKKSKKSSDLTSEEVSEMDEKELKGLIKEHDLDVDLSDYKNLKKKVAAVIDALVEAGVIEED